MKKVLLIDVPNLFYRAFFAVPRTLTSPDGLLINAVFGTASAILSIKEKHNPSHIFAFNDLREKTFRHEKEVQYKAQRPPMDADLSAQLPLVYKLYDTMQIPIISSVGYEADDCIATSAEKFASEKHEVLILSSDQDLLGLVNSSVKVLRPINGGQTKEMNKEDVRELLGVYPHQVADYKAICGDPSDNLKGVRGIGKKGASDLINEFETLQGIFDNLDKIKGRKKELLEEGREDAFHTLSLTNLHYAVPGCNPELSDNENASWEEVDQFFQNLGFRLLSKRLRNMGLVEDEEKKKKESQQSLF